MNRSAKGLNAQMLRGVLISLAVAAAVFAVCALAGKTALDHTAYGKPFITQVEKRKISELQEYVDYEQVTQENLRLLDVWCSRNGKLFLCVYRQGVLIYQSDAPQGGSDDADITWEDPQREYELTLSDGTAVSAFLYYYAGEVYYYALILISVLVAMAAFSVCFIRLAHRKVAYIREMRDELDILAGGDLSYRMTVKGKDELSQLAEGIDEMRRSIVTHQEAEQRIRSANSELITAMSHDLRTPLTSLIGYLELLDRDKCADEKQRRTFVGNSLDKAVQIKEMADKLFAYALTASPGEEREEPERLEAAVLLPQMLEEYGTALETRGFRVTTELQPLSGDVMVNTELLRRVFDNLYGNLVKYADPDTPVAVSCGRDGDGLRLRMTNGVRADRNGTRGTRIGLKTCERILRRHGGSFSSREEDGSFTVELTLPVAPD